MRRTIAMLVVCLFMTFGVRQQAEATASLTVLAMNAAGASISGTGVMTVAARAAVAGYTYCAGATWVAATLTVAGTATLAGIALAGGYMIGQGAMSAYAQKKGWGVNAQGVPTQMVATSYALASQNNKPASVALCGGAFLTTMGYYPTMAAARAAAVSDGRSMINDNLVDPNGWHQYGVTAYESCDASHVKVYAYWAPPDSHPEYVVPVGSVETPIDRSAVSAAVQADVNSADADTKAKARGVALAAAGALQEGFNAGTLAPADQQGVRDALVSGVSTADSTAVLAKDTAANAGTNAVTAATDAQTASSQAAAVQAGTDAAAKDGYADPGAIPPEPDPSTPTKLSLTAVLNTFWAGLQGLPLVSVLNGIGWQNSGASPVIQIPLSGSILGGGQTLVINLDSDAIFGVNYGTWLAMVGNLIYGLVGIRWTMYLFEG